MKAIINWLDHRTGIRGLIRASLFEHIPGGARWRYVWGSTLMFTFFIQAVTGIALWMAYSPSSQTAWESVYYIQHEMWYGWLLRGIHHYTAQAMTILLVLHLMQVVIDGAYRAPREFNFWIGLILLQLVLAMGLTGYLLPWDQKGYWATKVATGLAENVPYVGHGLQQLAVGGSEYGHHTLTRFFALHAGIIPGAIVALIVVHIYLFRRHGITSRPRGGSMMSRIFSFDCAKAPKDGEKPRDGMFWPSQVLRDGVACLAVLAAVLFFPFYHHGAPLSAPAEPSDEFSAARPEWYFLFLFYLLKLVPPFLGAIVIPGIIMAIMFFMPILGRSKVGHRINVFALFAVLIGAGVLTVMALVADSKDEKFQAALAQAEIESQRAIELAQSPAGIPVDGMRMRMLRDPKLQGPKLFAQHCASCHRYDGTDGLGNIPTDPQTAADLKDFHKKQWLVDFFDPKHIGTTKYFGGTPFAKDSDMIKYVTDSDIPEYLDEDHENLAKLIDLFDKIAQDRKVGENKEQQKQINDEHKKVIAAASVLFEDIALRCSDCHNFADVDGSTKGPDLTGYRSRQWMIDIIRDPEHVGYKPKMRDTDDKTVKAEKRKKYRAKYNMPAFHTSGQLDDQTIEIIVDWLRGNWYEPEDKDQGEDEQSNPAPDNDKPTPKTDDGKPTPKSDDDKPTPKSDGKE